MLSGKTQITNKFRSAMKGDGIKCPKPSKKKKKSITGHPSYRLYLDSGASVHILFCRELMGKMHNLKKPIEISGAGGKRIELKEYASLHKAFQHLPLPTNKLYYEPGALANLLLFAKLADKYYIVCNTCIDDAIYVQSKEDGKYLHFQRCRKTNLYYLDIGESEPDGYCHFNTVKNRKLKFSMINQKRAKAVRLLQEMCGFPAYENFINALECNVIPGIDFGRRDVKIANEIYGYSTRASKGKMKHPRKGQQMDRMSEQLAITVPPNILNHYGTVHLDMDIMFVNDIAFFLTTSRDIGFIHCKPVVSKHNKRVQNALKAIVSDYNSKGFVVKTAFGDNAFAPLKEWMKTELDIELDTCDSNSHVPRAEKSIQFVKEQTRCVQSQMPFKKYFGRLTIEMVRRVVILINSFAWKLGVHDVMSPRQIIYGKRFHTPLCKIGELVLAYNTEVSNDTGKERAFFALYVGPRDNGTGHEVIKLSTKQRVNTPKCIPKPMTQDIIDVVNLLGEEEGLQDGIQFLDIHGKATVLDLYPADGDENDYVHLTKTIRRMMMKSQTEKHWKMWMT